MTPAFCSFWMAAHRGRAQAELSGLVVLKIQKSEVEEVEVAGFVDQWTKEQVAMQRNLQKSTLVGYWILNYLSMQSMKTHSQAGNH